jgi:alanyl-tRNA synthetase
MDEHALAVERLAAGQKGYLVTNRTPFYGASGGQSGDIGTIASPSGKVRVVDTIKPSPELVVHHVEAVEGDILLDQEVDLTVTEDDRVASARNHTCTHLLHAALRRVLGDHVKQAGSLVAPDRLRFDFTHIAPMTPEELAAVEREVNRVIMADIPLETDHMHYDDAVKRGAMALFGEKYGDEVRVVAIADESVELCGGTHLRATGQAGLFLIVSESGVAAGVRRIEALTGWNAMHAVLAQRSEQAQLSAMLKARPGEIVSRVESLQKENRTLRKDMERAAAQATSGQGRNIMDEATDVAGVKLLAAKVEVPNVKALRDLMDDVRSKLVSGIACLAAVDGDKVQLIIAVSKDLQTRFTAPQLIKDVAAEVGGSGGGRPDMAQAGGTNPAGIDAAFAKLRSLIGG